MRSLERAIEVMTVLEEAERPLALGDIAIRSGLPVATAQNVLGVLEASGRVEKDVRGYRAGIALLFGANAYLATSPLVTVARRVLDELAGRTGLTASLFVRSRWHRALAARVHGVRPLPYELSIGAKLPLHLGAGKVLAAGLSSEELDEFLIHVREATNAGDSGSWEVAFRDDLQEIREQGFYVALGERRLGALSVSAPILSSDGKVLAALSAGGATADVNDKDIALFTVEVRRAASAVSAHG